MNQPAWQGLLAPWRVAKGRPWTRGQDRSQARCRDSSNWRPWMNSRSGAAKEVEFEGRVYALYNIDGVDLGDRRDLPASGRPARRRASSRERRSLAPGMAGSSMFGPARPRWARRSSSPSTKSRSRIKTCWSPFLEPDARSPRLQSGRPLVAAAARISDPTRIDLGDPDR